MVVSAPQSVAPQVAPQPFLKWAGGKSRLISQYTRFFPQGFHTYHEPFLGGGAIFFHLLPPRSVLMDINAELVNVYLCVRDQVEAVIALLAEHKIRHGEDYYYWVRANPGQTRVQRAARLIYLNKTCFNGLYRENSKGHFNVPMGRYKNPAIHNPELLRSVSAALQQTEIRLGSFETILDWAKTNRDFVYFDPPYHPISRTSRFTAYSRHSFHEPDQVRLRDTFVTLAERGVKVMLSNSDCDLVRELYQDFQIHPIWAARAINSNAKKRGKIPEVLVTSY